LFGNYRIFHKHPNPLSSGREVSMILDLSKNDQLWVFRCAETYDADLLRELENGLQKADVLIDVGANVGIYALTLAQRFPNKNVLAVEPFDASIRALSTHARLNGLANVQILNGV